jgi:hypothetical protein
MSISMNMTGTWRRHLARVSAPLRAPAPPPLPSTPLSCPRPVIRGKFLLAGEQKLYVRGVTYGAFRPDAEGNEYHDLDTIEQAWFRDIRFRRLELALEPEMRIEIPLAPFGDGTV